MATRTWLGRAGLIYQTTTITVGGTAAAANTYTLTIGLATVTYTATGTDTNATIAQALQTALSSSASPEFQVANYTVSSLVVTMTANVAGTPYTISQGTTGTGSLSLSTTVANVSPNDVGNANNWSSATAPVNSDSIVFENSSVDAIWNLESAFSSNTFAALTVKDTYTGTIGNPTYSASGFYEYRGTTWTCAQITALTVAQSQQAQAGSYKFNVGSNTCGILVTGTDTGGTVENELMWFQGSSSDNTLICNGGSIVLAPLTGQTAGLSSLKVTQGTVRGTTGLTFKAATVIDQTGGTVDLSSNVATWKVQDAGSGCNAFSRGTMTITTLTFESGNFFCLSSGTITNLTVGAGATLNFDGVPDAITVTNCTAEPGATIVDSQGRVTFTNGITVHGNLGSINYTTRENITVTVVTV